MADLGSNTLFWKIHTADATIVNRNFRLSDQTLKLFIDVREIDELEMTMRLVRVELGSVARLCVDGETAPTSSHVQRHRCWGRGRSTCSRP
jgi:hypothetical protein